MAKKYLFIYLCMSKYIQFSNFTHFTMQIYLSLIIYTSLYDKLYISLFLLISLVWEISHFCLIVYFVRFDRFAPTLFLPFFSGLIFLLNAYESINNPLYINIYKYIDLNILSLSPLFFCSLFFILTGVLSMFSERPPFH